VIGTSDRGVDAEPGELWSHEDAIALVVAAQELTNLVVSMRVILPSVEKVMRRSGRVEKWAFGLGGMCIGVFGCWLAIHVNPMLAASFLPSEWADAFVEVFGGGR